jgi:hypothetical protein
MVNASDCSVTVTLWKNFGRTSTENADKKDGCCMMQGVTCVGESVTKINWTELRLVGNILPEIGLLTELTSLSLSRNSISGSIPSDIGNLQKLITLELMNNQFSGAIPKDIGRLKRLKSLVLSNNYLSGSIPDSLALCTELKLLWLGGNRLSGSIPPDLELLNNLESLTLSDNQFSANISSCMINGMTSLASLDISNNPNLTGAIWPASPKLVFNTTRTNLIKCTDESPVCNSMKCLKPPNSTTPSWWMILLVIIIWILIVGIITLYINNSPIAQSKLTALWNSISGSIQRWKDSRQEDYDDKQYHKYNDDDTRSEVTKIEGFNQNVGNRDTIYSSRQSLLSARNRDTLISRSSSYGGIFRRSVYGGEYETDDKKAYTVVEPYTPANDDEIELITGDQVLILEQFEDGWAFGLNKSKNETGVFPLVCLK